MARRSGWAAATGTAVFLAFVEQVLIPALLQHPDAIVVMGNLAAHGDEEARRAVYNNCVRLRSGVAKEAFRLRAELVLRSFALVLDRGGMRRAWLPGRENLHKALPRARHATSCTSPATISAPSCASWSAPTRPGNSWPERRLTSWFLMAADGVLTGILIVATNTEAAVLAINFRPEPHG